MKQLVLLLLFPLLSTSLFAQATQRMPDACQLITSGDINRLLGTIVVPKESLAPGRSCPFHSNDRAVEVSIEYQSLADIAKAESLLKYTADSLKMQIANAQPVPYSQIVDFEGAGNGANYVVGKDELRGAVVRLQFVIDKHLVTFNTVGVPVETVTQSLPEIYRIIKRNSAL